MQPFSFIYNIFFAIHNSGCVKQVKKILKTSMILSLFSLMSKDNI